MPKRGEVWLADLNPPHGTVPGKTRPVLIVQSQALLDAGHPSTYAIPLTTQLVGGAEPLRIRLRADGRLRRDSNLPIMCLRPTKRGRPERQPQPTGLPQELVFDRAYGSDAGRRLTAAHMLSQ